MAVYRGWLANPRLGCDISPPSPQLSLDDDLMDSSESADSPDLWDSRYTPPSWNNWTPSPIKASNLNPHAIEFVPGVVQEDTVDTNWASWTWENAKEEETLGCTSVSKALEDFDDWDAVIKMEDQPRNMADYCTVKEKWVEPTISHCKYCYNTARYIWECEKRPVQSVLSPGQWLTHLVKDKNGYTTCPVLMQHVCPQCGLSGKYGHTSRYCGHYKKLYAKDNPHVSSTRH